MSVRSASLVSIPGLWRGLSSDTVDASGGGSSKVRASDVSSAVGALSGCVCLLWCALTARRWTVHGVRGVLSSDLFQPGSFARRALPASRGAEYANDGEKRALQSLGDLYGCHHCGRHINTHSQRRQAMLRQKSASKQPQSDQDHVLRPYNHAAMPRDGASGARTADGSVLGFVADHIPPSGLRRVDWLRGSRVAQNFWPQCTSCSSKQSRAVRSKQRTLVVSHWRRFTWSDLYPPALLLLPFADPVLQRLVGHVQYHLAG